MSSFSATAPRHAHVPPSRRGTTSVAALAVFALVVVGAAVVGSLAATSSKETYAALDKPWFAPPSWVFGPTWTALYVLIAIAGWRLWRASGVDAAVVWWGVQIVLNAAWTPLFFAADAYGLAFAELTLLVVSVIATVLLARRRDKIAALLLLPYLTWVVFAGALNLGVWLLN
ncbi:TspO/MBR family protein [Nocardioides sp. R-C-SC26]|uniref:TspO/MBR family protein n=1 Tax=Nocardioides sp. R-C-SC26 TaxID=2870414 RepID=UPI001E3686E7|nr:TspO/MBR family protein [Nocardioides sp. R-C-SC26]